MNNKKNAGKTARFFGLIWLLTLILLVVSLFYEIGLGQIAQIGLILFLLFTAVLFHSGGFFFIELETDKSAFRIKHYNIFPFWQEFKVYQIPLERYKKYEIKKFAGGLFSWLYLFEQTNRGLAKYPAIGVSALSSSELKTLVDYLESIKKI
jgi:hypothetical protein